MRINIVSRKYGWYLAKITGTIENIKNIVVTDLETIRKYNLIPGRYVKISILKKAHCRKSLMDTFIVLPYFRELIKTYWLLKNIIKSLTDIKFRYVDDEYINEIIKIMRNFYQMINGNKFLKLRELLEFDEPDNQEMNIAMPESWLYENGVDLGEIVLLRNDFPMPIVV